MEWYADSPLEAGASLWLQCGRGEPRAVRALSVRQHKGRPLVTLENVPDRTAAEGLRGCEVFMARADLPQPDEGEVFVEDLLGCDVLLPDGQRVGRLDHVEYPADQEIWSIITDAGREILFPAQPCFIVGFDLGPLAASADAQASSAAKPSVTIAPPEGLLDIYLSPEQA